MRPSGGCDTRTVLLYAQDHQGMGHVTRTLTIARHLLGAFPGCLAYIATKSPVASHFTLPDRCDYIKLPARLVAAASPLTEDEEEAARRRFRRIRADILRAAALGLGPDLVLVDHEPLGAKGEFKDGLYALKAQRPGTRFVFGMRDIMDDPARIRAAWEALGVYDALERLYDGIAVYGSRALYDVADAYAIPASVRPKLHYCGYVVREAAASDAGRAREQHGLPPDGPLVLATVGSGSDGYPVLEAAAAALEQLRARIPDLAAILVTGPFMPARQRAELESRAHGACRVVSVADTLQLMAAADVVLSMGGYNTVCEALQLGRPLVIVPRATHKVEQRIRAETLAARGLARWVHPRDLTADRLVDGLEWALSCDRGTHARRVQEIIPAFDGAARITAYLSRWLGAD